MPDLPATAFDPTVGPRLLLRSPDGLLEEEVFLNNDGTLSIGTTPKKIQTGGTNSIIVCFTDV